MLREVTRVRSGIHMSEGQIRYSYTALAADVVARKNRLRRKSQSDESERVALASATRFCGAELRSPKAPQNPRVRTGRGCDARVLHAWNK